MLLRMMILALIPVAIWAQGSGATVTGLVTDASGALVPGATVTVTNRGTAVASRTETNEAGLYILPTLIPGSYSLEVQKPGFKTYRVDNFTLETGQKLRLDVVMRVGEVREQVEVQAAVTPLQQETAEISKTITSTELRNIPLSFRTAYGLMVLTPGIASSGNDPSIIGSDDHVSINGSRRGGNAFYIDGAPTTHIGGIPERLGSIEAVHEVKILTNTYSAEYGRTSGGFVMIQVKSGTQHYHGSLYEFHRNSALDAAQWENNARGIRQTALRRNEFGGTLGGPFPRLRDRLFFFASYEGLRDNIPSTTTRTIPDPAMRTGDFSASPVVVSDPLAGAPFPGNVIPPSRCDRAALKFMALFPQPNATGVYDPRYGIRTLNWVLALPRSDNKNYGITRWDYNPTEKQKLFVTFSHINEGPRILARDFDNVLITTVGPRYRNIRRLTMGYTRFIRTNLINEFIAASQRDPRVIEPWFPNFDVTKELGIARRIGTTLPVITISGFGNFGNSSVQRWVHQPSSLQNIVTSTRGAHAVRAGAQLSQNQFWYISAGNTTGTYTFNGEITGSGARGRDNPVNALADLVLGAVKTSSINVSQIPVCRVNYNFAAFINDDWKLTSRLTVNLGLRYEFETKQIVKNNVYSRVDLDTGELLVAGRNASPNLNLQNHYLNFSPRLGAAFALTPKTVLHTGAGVFRSNFWVDNGGMVSYPGWTGTVVQVDQGLGRAQPFRFSEGFPVEQVPAVVDPLKLAAEASLSRPLSVAAVTYSPKDKVPLIYQWNFGIQRDIGWDTVVDVSYVASRSLWLSRTIPVNNPRLERASEVVIQRVPIQQVRPYPRYSAFNAVFYDARAAYHSLQMRASRRFRAGLALDANYTFSKNLDTASNLSDSFQIPWQFHHELEKGLSGLDRTHILSAGWVYELPFGRNRRFFSDRKLLAALLGGFEFNGIFNASTGLPLNIRQNNTNLILSAQRPDVIDPSRLDGRLSRPEEAGPGARRWLISPTAPDSPFRPSSPLGFGNLGRNTSREPGFWTFNLSLFRSFPLTESVKFELRFEAFNALNHVNYLEPASTNIDTPAYGLIQASAPARQIQVGARLSF